MESDFHDIDPWQEPAPQESARQTSTTANVKEKAMKMSSLIDHQDDGALYVDFGVFGPYERKLTKVQKWRIFTCLGDGTFLQRDLPGPPTYQGWLAAWRVLKTALLMLNVATLASLEIYGKHIEHHRAPGDTVADGLRLDLRCRQLSPCREDVKDEKAVQC